MPDETQVAHKLAESYSMTALSMWYYLTLPYHTFEVRAVFLDIAKAFDKVLHEGLIFKLKQNGISGNPLIFFESYVHNRKQQKKHPQITGNSSLMGLKLPK